MIFAGQVYFLNRVRNLSFLIPDSLGSYSQIFKKRGMYVQDFNLPTCGQCCLSLCFDKSPHFLWPERKKVYFPLVAWPELRIERHCCLQFFDCSIGFRKVSPTWRKQAHEHEICLELIFWSQLLQSYPRIFNDGLRPGHTLLSLNFHWNQWNYFHWCQQKKVH